MNLKKLNRFQIGLLDAIRGDLKGKVRTISSSPNSPPSAEELFLATGAAVALVFAKKIPLSAAAAFGKASGLGSSRGPDIDEGTQVKMEGLFKLEPRGKYKSVEELARILPGTFKYIIEDKERLKAARSHAKLQRRACV